MTTLQHSIKNTNDNQGNNNQDSNNERVSRQPDFEAQIIDLQMHMAHLELTVERLDHVITQQDQHIRELQRQLQLVYQQVENQSADNGIAPFDVMADRPPHY